MVKRGSYLGERETNNDPSQLYIDHKLNIKHDARLTFKKVSIIMPWYQPFFLLINLNRIAELGQICMK